MTTKCFISGIDPSPAVNREAEPKCDINSKTICDGDEERRVKTTKIICSVLSCCSHIVYMILMRILRYSITYDACLTKPLVTCHRLSKYKQTYHKNKQTRRCRGNWKTTKVTVKNWTHTHTVRVRHRHMRDKSVQVRDHILLMSVLCFDSTWRLPVVWALRLFKCFFSVFKLVISIGLSYVCTCIQYIHYIRSICKWMIYMIWRR